MKKALTLSIVIPVYNESRYLRICLDSIKKQSVLPDEVIVVDNNSTDSSVKIANKYSFVRVVKEKKQGIVYARNRGFDSAHSDIIGRIDADTILPIDWVKDVLEFYAVPGNKNNAWSSAGYFYNIYLYKINGWLQTQIAFRFNRILMGHYILWGATMAMTAEQWKKVKSEVCMRNDIHEDLDLSIHLHRLGYKITYESGINVAVVMRRVLDDRHKLWKNLYLWPQTLRVHGMKSWVFGWVGAVVLYVGSPLLVINDNIGKFSETKLFQYLKMKY